MVRLPSGVQQVITESCFGRIVHPHPVSFPNDATLRDRLKLVVPQCTAAFDESDEASFLMSLPSREVSAGLTWNAPMRQPENGTSGRFQAWTTLRFSVPSN
jgi:hypothetical protein